MRLYTVKSILPLLALLCIFLSAACATAPLNLNAIPSPPPTAKLRVYVHPLTGYGTWVTPHREFAARTANVVERYLEETGIYEVVSAQDARAVLNNRTFTAKQLSSNDWRLAKEIGRALYADYVMILERNIGGALGGYDFTVDNIMINVETGQKFKSSYGLNRITRYDRSRTVDLVRATHRDIFRLAKQDMLATAIKKGRRITLPKGPAAVIETTAQQTPKPSAPPAPTPAVQERKQAPLPERKNVEQPEQVKKTEQSVTTPEQKPSERDRIKEKSAGNALTPDSGPSKGTKLVVFDLDAPENYRPVALILTEALREELFMLRKFVLVNRENLQQVLQEMALQQTGLIDEKQAIKTGKGMAANQVVTGRLGLFGKTYVLQAKRIDVETFATLGLTSTKFKEGQEDEVLSRMKDVAKSLSGL